MPKPANSPNADGDLKDALDNLKEAVELFCVAFHEARQVSCPLSSAEALTAELLERGLQQEPELIARHGLEGQHSRLRRQWQEWTRIPRHSGEVEIDLGGHHGVDVLARYARRLVETSAQYLRRITSHRFEPARRRLIMPQAAGRIIIVTGEDHGFALELHTTAREDWQTGAIASYLKMANPALLGEFTIG